MENPDNDFIEEVIKFKNILDNFLLNKNSIDNKNKEKFLKEMENLRYKLFEKANIKNTYSQDKIDFINNHYESEFKKGILKITIPEVLPKYKNISNYAYKNIMINTAKSVQKYKELFNENLTFVLIIVHEKQANMDIDNKYIKPIIDALVLQKIIKDDNINNMFYMVLGKNDTKKPYTEVFVMNSKYMIEWIESMKKIF